MARRRRPVTVEPKRPCRGCGRMQHERYLTSDGKCGACKDQMPLW